MPRLGAAMAEQQPLSALGIQAHRDQRRDAANETVHQHRNTFLGAGQVSAHQGRDFKTAKVQQGLQRIATLSAVQGQCALDHLSLMADACRIQPGARPGQMHHRTFQQCARQGTGRRGVADAHLTTDEQLGARRECALHAVATGLESSLTLSLGHRRTLHKIRRPRTDVQMTHTRQVQCRRHRAQVHHFEGSPQLPRQHADRCTAGDEVMQHLPGNLLGKCRYPFRHHTMVTGKNRDPQLIQAWLDLPLQSRQLHRHRFELTERAGRLGQLLLTGLRLLDHVDVDRFARVQPPGLGHNAVPFKVRGRPATVRMTR